MNIQTTLFNVRKVELSEPIGKWTHQIQDELGRPICNVSAGYRLIPNRDVVAPFLERFGESSLTRCARNGNRFFFKFDVGEEFDLGEGDMIRPQLIIENSYDKSRSYRFFGGAFRKVCTNGMYGVALGLNFRQVHMGEIPVADHVRETMRILDKGLSFEFWKNLRAIKMTGHQKIELVQGFKPFDVEQEKTKPEDPYWWAHGNERKNRLILEHSKREIWAPEGLNNQPNGWGLLNNVNAAVRRTFTNANLTDVVACNLRLEAYLKTQLCLN